MHIKSKITCPMTARPIRPSSAMSVSFPDLCTEVQKLQISKGLETEGLREYTVEEIARLLSDGFGCCDGRNKQFPRCSAPYDAAG
jgi:hypothetical protein